MVSNFCDVSGFLFRVFMIFWGLTLYDIYIPKGAYENEMLRVKKLMAGLQDNIELVNFTRW